jgi:hypothetical protein
MQKWNIARIFQQTYVITSPEYAGILIRTISTWKVTKRLRNRMPLGKLAEFL